MGIPIATTTISVLRRQVLATDDPYEVTAAAEVAASGVRAVIGAPSGTELVVGAAGQEDVTHRLDCDTVALESTDQVRDDVTSEVFNVVWARQRSGLGLDHTVAGLRQVSGVA